MTDLQEKIANMYAKIGAPSCLPDGYKKDIAAKTEDADEYLREITNVAKQMLHDLDAGKTPEGKVFIWDRRPHSSGYEVSIFRSALETFNSKTAKPQGYGMYAVIEPEFAPNYYYANLHLGPPVN